ncbi:hypothetical protein HEK616_40480 [Streptomyces nigrescens]|uniref:Uncharacterized protein n=1 Tax=Streptomyces nigrescens TaxID=1920 RepID=A0ABM7ZWF5_STRNI|nr:hypothetical protein [Streptomyces nigrescens]BDM70561.1 hypothetical protein HEK616_40480 [Streptomyces nigrescens]
MISVLTGPQGTEEQRGTLCELAGLYGLLPVIATRVDWLTVSVLYCVAGWQSCADALSDVALAECFGVPVKDLPLN